MSESISLATLFDAVKVAQKANKGKVVLRRKVKNIDEPILPVTDNNDEWTFTDEQKQVVVEMLEYVPEARVVLFRAWSCPCGGCGHSYLGLFIRERSTKLHTLRWRNVGIKFNYIDFDLPQVTEWLDTQEVDVCPECATLDTVEIPAFAFGEQLAFAFGEETPESLVPLVEKLVKPMLVAKPGFDELGRRILSPAICLKEEHSSVSGEATGYVEDRAEQAREIARAAARRFG